MLGRSVKALATNGVPVVYQQQRGMANLKIISLRLKSVKNIQKITMSMKMVSAAKFARAERDLKAARPYGEGAQAFYNNAEVTVEGQEAPKELFVAITSDKGLCGAVHSNICKKIRLQLNEKESLDNCGVVCVGDKSRAQLGRTHPKQIVSVGKDIGRLPPQFGDASRVANAIINGDFEYDVIRLYYNQFKSVVSYKTKDINAFSLKTVEGADKITIYDSLDSDVLQSYMEYSLASLIFFCMKEGATSEQSSRMTAMDASSKNAGEMIEALTLKFNRTRQSVITGELIEIISGASALE